MQKKSPICSQQTHTRCRHKRLTGSRPLSTTIAIFSVLLQPSFFLLTHTHAPISLITSRPSVVTCPICLTSTHAGTRTNPRGCFPLSSFAPDRHYRPVFSLRCQSLSANMDTADTTSHRARLPSLYPSSHPNGRDNYRTREKVAKNTEAPRPHSRLNLRASSASAVPPRRMMRPEPSSG